MIDANTLIGIYMPTDAPYDPNTGLRSVIIKAGEPDIVQDLQANVTSFHVLIAPNNMIVAAQAV